MAGHIGLATRPRRHRSRRRDRRQGFQTKEETMRDSIRAVLRCLAVLAAAVSLNAWAQAPITLHGAVQFNDDHAFTRALVKFQELTQQYYGKPVNFVLHKNSELGLEKD